MIPLITLSHGSRNPAAAVGIEALTAAVGDVLEVPAVAAHLELSTPGLDDVVAQLSAQGITRAVVAPLLFTNAFHNTVDVPQAVRDAQDIHGVELLVAPHLGTGIDIAEVLSQRVLRDAAVDSNVVLYAVGSSNPAANDAVRDLGRTVAALSARPIEVVFATGPEAAALTGTDIHIVPLFVTAGLLLDRATRQGGVVTQSAPLTTALVPVVAARYRVAVSSLLARA